MLLTCCLRGRESGTCTTSAASFLARAGTGGEQALMGGRGGAGEVSNGSLPSALARWRRVATAGMGGEGAEARDRGGRAVLVVATTLLCSLCFSFMMRVELFLMGILEGFRQEPFE